MILNQVLLWLMFAGLFVLWDVVVFCSGVGVCYYDGKGGKNHAREAQ
ncbi:hypothetical protein GX645_00500 [Candidatus Sumerlaeota bacterium]|nr:hypothetical protein [Candidatus Sumerlaeota bacterium]